LIFLPPCSLHMIPFVHRVHQAEPTFLFTPRRPRNAKTFRARLSPALTQNKPQPAPAILGQVAVHIMLSITHHTRERPSTSPRTLRSSKIALIHVPTQNQIADIFSNPLDQATFTRLRGELGVCLVY
jgi:hypothetical protein